MDQHTFDVGYRRLKGYYAVKDNEEKFQIWRIKLQPIDGKAYTEAVDAWIEGERYFPTLGQLKALIYTKTSSTRGPGGDLSDVDAQDMALGADLFPLFERYLHGLYTKEEWITQMRYFAEKHGKGKIMEASIQETGIENERDRSEVPAGSVDPSDGTLDRGSDVEVSDKARQQRGDDEHIPGSGVIKRPRSIEERLKSSPELHDPVERDSHDPVERTPRGRDKPKPNGPVHTDEVKYPKREGGW